MRRTVFTSAVDTNAIYAVFGVPIPPKDRDMTISTNTNIDLPVLCKTFTLDAGVTLSSDTAKEIMIIADTITINGTIDMVGKGYEGAAGTDDNSSNAAGDPNIVLGGSGASGGTANFGDAAAGKGGDALFPGADARSGINLGGLPGKNVGNHIGGSLANILDLRNLLCGAAGSAGAGRNSGSSSGIGGDGGDGGGGIVLIAKTIILAATAILDSSGGQGQDGTYGTGINPGAGGGGGAGPIILGYTTLIDEGATFNYAGGAGGSIHNAGGKGGDGVLLKITA